MSSQEWLGLLGVTGLEGSRCRLGLQASSPWEDLRHRVLRLLVGALNRPCSAIPAAACCSKLVYCHLAVVCGMSCQVKDRPSVICRLQVKWGAQLWRWGPSLPGESAHPTWRRGVCGGPCSTLQSDRPCPDAASSRPKLSANGGSIRAYCLSVCTHAADLSNLWHKWTTINLAGWAVSFTCPWCNSPTSTIPCLQQFLTRRDGEHQVPPLTSTRFVVADRGDCSPRCMRATLNNVPATRDLCGLGSMAMAVVLCPLALPDPRDDPVQVMTPHNRMLICLCVSLSCSPE